MTQRNPHSDDEIIAKMKTHIEMQNKSIQRSTITASETEVQGMTVIEELRLQREALQRTADATKDTLTTSSTARRVIDKLKLADVQERILKVLIILVLLATIVVLFKVKFVDR